MDKRTDDEWMNSMEEVMHLITELQKEMAKNNVEKNTKHSETITMHDQQG